MRKKSWISQSFLYVQQAAILLFAAAGAVAGDGFENLATRAKITASSVLDGDKYAASNIADGRIAPAIDIGRAIWDWGVDWDLSVPESARTRINPPIINSRKRSDLFLIY